MTTQKKYEDYKSTGAMMKAGDFEALIRDITEMVESGKLKEFNKRTSQKPISEFDDLLFFFPQYAYKMEEKKDEEDNVEMVRSNELQPRALEFLELCLKNGANPNAYMKNGENTYLKACELPTTEILDYLVNNPYNPVDLTHTDGNCNNGLYYATMAEATEVMEYLVKKCNFDVNEKNFFIDNQTVFFSACGHGKEKSIDKLLELGADPTLKDAYGNMPYHMILVACDEETREEYLDSPDEIAKWDALYAKVTQLTEDYKLANPKKLKVKFN